jgi:hypothetical protein
MSSVQSFIRQIPLATTYYTCPSGTELYPFVPTAANSIPGNYPNGVGYVDLSGSLFVYNPTGYILRDMGKTIKCTFGAPSSTNTTQYFFREVQVLQNGAVQNGLTTFGVYGVPSTGAASNSYNTYYFPVSIGGSAVPTEAEGIFLTPIAGGQM